MHNIQVISKNSLEKERFNCQIDGFELSAYYSKNTPQELAFSEGSIYLFIQEGSIDLKTNGSSFALSTGHYLTIKAPLKIILNKDSYVFFIQTPSNYRSLNTIGGPIEDLGRLKYIDGCSDTLLIPPTMLGEPCLNFLHFPTATKQTMHNHPSFRFGVVARGNGFSITEDAKQELNTGDIFLIPTLVKHKFDTNENIMDVIAFHPDSDWGPTDEVHPMINRTWVDGKKI